MSEKEIFILSARGVQRFSSCFEKDFFPVGRSFVVNKKNLSYINATDQKLEFYGDSLIEKEVSGYLYNKNLTEGEMTLARIKMVNHHSLAKIAKDLHFEDFIMVGTSYHLDHISDKNYEDIFEAFCAALYLTNGENKLKIFITNTIIKYYENKMLEDNHAYQIFAYILEIWFCNHDYLQAFCFHNI